LAEKLLYPAPLGSAATVVGDGGNVADGGDGEATRLQRPDRCFASAAGTANTPTALVEGTDYLVHYESGNDFLVWVTDQSAASTVALIAY
jgi:hypothetical protein